MSRALLKRLAKLEVLRARVDNAGNQWRALLNQCFAAESVALCARLNLPMPVDLSNLTDDEWEAAASAQQYELTQNVAALIREYLPPESP